MNLMPLRKRLEQAEASRTARPARPATPTRDQMRLITRRLLGLRDPAELDAIADAYVADLIEMEGLV